MSASGEFRVNSLSDRVANISDQRHDSRTQVDGKAQLIAENPKPVAGPKILAADHQAKELERLEKEVRFTEGAMPPERACELACEFLKQQDNDPLLDKLDDTSPWNRNNEPNQACCTLS